MNVSRKSNYAVIDKLDEIAQASVAVGWFPETTYPDGMPVAAVAAQNEYGSVRNVEAHETTVYRSLNKSGEFNKGGRFVKRSKSNYATKHNVPAHQVRIPPRPFIRPAIHKNEQKWDKEAEGFFRKALKGGSVRDAMQAIGAVIKGDIQREINSVYSPPNAPSTIRRKGHAKPLIDTGFMWKSISVKIGGEE